MKLCIQLKKVLNKKITEQLDMELCFKVIQKQKYHKCVALKNLSCDDVIKIFNITDVN